MAMRVDRLYKQTATKACGSTGGPMKAPSAIEIVLLMFLLINILVVLLQFRLLEIARRVGVVSRLDIKLDLLLKQAGIEYDPYKDLPSDVTDAVRRGAKIEAIKRYCESTGTTLKDAKQFIEEVQRRAGVEN
jgi:ribosomal protein L7/L12